MDAPEGAAGLWGWGRGLRCPCSDSCPLPPPPAPRSLQQQLQAHQLSQLQALALPLTPLPVGLQPPSLPAVSAGSGLLSLSALGSQAHLAKEDKNGHDGDAHQDDDGEKSD